MVFIAATIYGFAKSYLWPTMIGIVGERFPKGGALTLNVTTGVGMITVGIIGAVFLGYVQDKEIDKNLANYDKQNQTTFQKEYITLEKKSIFGTYQALDVSKSESAEPKEKETITTAQIKAQKGALKTVAVLPVFMLMFFILLLSILSEREVTDLLNWNKLYDFGG